MTVSLNGRLTLRELMEQAWQQVEAQARTMLKGAVEGLLQAERDRRVAEASRCGEKVYRWGYTVRKCWTQEKEHNPKDDAMSMAAAMGVELLTEEHYRELQKLGKVRYEDVHLGENASGDQKTRRCPLL